MNRSLKIGVAEDEPDVREFYKCVIPELGHQLLWLARDGVDMIEKSNEAWPDLIIADVKMPRLDGIDAVRSITSRCPIPVILVSGYYDSETMSRAEVAQVASYLVKPVREADLKAAINIVVQQNDKLESMRDEKQRLSINYAVHRVASLPGMNEQQAYRRLEQMASQEHLKLSEVAETISSDLDSEEIQLDS
jgi:YesN/AraC family two-component response regulator